MPKRLDALAVLLTLVDCALREAAVSTAQPFFFFFSRLFMMRVTAPSETGGRKPRILFVLHLRLISFVYAIYYSSTTAVCSIIVHSLSVCILYLHKT